MKKLFCDCKTDEEKANFFLSGRAVETGIIAPAISNDVAMAYHRCAEFQKEIKALRAKVEAMERQKPVAEWFSWLPEGATHIDKIRTVLIPNYGCKAWFSAFKYVDGVLYTFRSDSDNEYEQWIKAAPLYKEGMVPKVYPLYALPGAKGEGK